MDQCMYKTGTCSNGVTQWFAYQGILLALEVCVDEVCSSIFFCVILCQNLTEDVSHTMDVYTIQTITNYHTATDDIDLDYFRG